MSKITVTEALELVPIGKTTLYEMLDNGTLSYTTNARGWKVVDIAELHRVFPEMTNGNRSETDSEQTEQTRTPAPAPIVIDLLQERIASLESQLETAGKEKSELLKLLSNEQERTRILMLPDTQQKTKTRWYNHIFRKR